MENIKRDLKNVTPGLVQAGQSAQAGAQETTAKKRYDDGWPPHIKRFVALIEAKFVPGNASVELDYIDGLGYGRQVTNLTGKQCRQLFLALQEAYTFRPSVADVRTMAHSLFPPRYSDIPTVEEVRAKHEADFKQPLRLQSAAASYPGGGRQYARDMIAALRAGKKFNPTPKQG